MIFSSETLKQKHSVKSGYSDVVFHSSALHDKNTRECVSHVDRAWLQTLRGGFDSWLGPITSDGVRVSLFSLPKTVQNTSGRTRRIKTVLSSKAVPEPTARQDSGAIPKTFEASNPSLIYLIYFQTHWQQRNSSFKMKYNFSNIKTWIKTLANAGFADVIKQTFFLSKISSQM